jgi:hypothetical protein
MRKSASVAVDVALQEAIVEPEFAGDPVAVGEHPRTKQGKSS